MKKLILADLIPEHRDVAIAVFRLLLEASESKQPANVKFFADCVPCGGGGMMKRPGGGVRMIIDVGALPEIAADDLWASIGDLEDDGT